MDYSKKIRKKAKKLGISEGSSYGIDLETFDRTVNEAWANRRADRALWISYAAILISLLSLIFNIAINYR